MADEKILMVMMAVTDMAKAKAFYAEQLGFQVTSAGDHHSHDRCDQLLQPSTLPPDREPIRIDQTTGDEHIGATPRMIQRRADCLATRASSAQRP